MWWFLIYRRLRRGNKIFSSYSHKNLWIQLSSWKIVKFHSPRRKAMKSVIKDFLCRQLWSNIISVTLIAFFGGKKKHLETLLLWLSCVFILTRLLCERFQWIKHDDNKPINRFLITVDFLVIWGVIRLFAWLLWVRWNWRGN